MMNWISDLRGDLDHAERLETDLAYFAEQYLRIRPKAGSLVPFVFNAAQLELHRRLEEQKAETGKVRAIVLKARQEPSARLRASSPSAQALPRRECT